jgi:hypothetical protein
MLDPNGIAESYLALIRQDRRVWPEDLRSNHVGSASDEALRKQVSGYPAHAKDYFSQFLLIAR